MDITPKLKPYIAIANMLADSLGEKCEVVLHDLSNPKNSVVHVANGLITGRAVGQSFDHLIKHVLLSKNFQNDYTANYTFTAENGKQIKSSTALIRDENDEVIGAFCINMEVDDLLKFQKFLNRFLSKEDEKPCMASDNPDNKQGAPDEESLSSVTEIIDNIIHKTIAGIDVTALKRKDSIELITFMYDKGIFLAKGSVDKVANVMGISPVTVYSYLDEVKKAGQKK